jgi:phosphoribosylformimino-5-aminoimidazole carboxamide ribotide isomerase
MAEFALYPAIDLRRGRCVRLEKGRADRETVYGEDPAAVAAGFAAAGASWIHVVDLDAAFGDGTNRPIIRALASTPGVRVQTGGGLRTEEDLAEVLDAGAARAVIGTAAIENPDLVRIAVDRWGADRIAVGLDARGRRPAARGWVEESGADLFDLARSLVERGVRTLIHTDIERDGMMMGPNLELSAELAAHAGAEVIVSGGMRGIGDVRAVAAAAREGRGIAGAIMGRAIYEGAVDVREALEAARRRDGRVRPRLPAHGPGRPGRGRRHRLTPAAPLKNEARLPSWEVRLFVVPSLCSCTIRTGCRPERAICKHNSRHR